MNNSDVINGLGCCIEEPQICTICPYAYATYPTKTCKRKLRDDAISKIKSQEPVKPIVGHNIGPTWWYACVECKGAIDIGDKFCRHCGRALKWES